MYDCAITHDMHTHADPEPLASDDLIALLVSKASPVMNAIQIVRN